MRKTILLMSLFAAAFYAANATAETIEFQGKVGANAYYADAINWIGEVAPTIDDDVVLDNSKLLDTKTHDLNLNVDGQAGSLTIIDNAANQISSVNGPKTFQIAGNLTRLEKNKTGTWFSINSGGIWTGATTPVGDAPLDLIIGGKVVVGEAADTQVAGSLPKTGGGMQFGGTGSPDSEASWSRALNSLRITGDIELYYTSTFILNVYNRNRNSSVENPDAIIGGVVKLIGTESTGDSSTSWKNPSFSILNGVDNTFIGDSFVSHVAVGGLQGNSTLNTSVSSTFTTKTLGVLVLNNAAGTDYTHSGWVWDNGNKQSELNQFKIVMNGQGIQRFTGDRQGFSGGVEMRSGTLQLAANVLDYAGVDTYSASNHGDLTFLSGNLILKSKDAKGEFGFNNLILSSGKITLTLSDTSVDLVKLYGTIIEGDALDVLLFDFSSSNIEYLTGEFRKIVEWQTKTTLSEDNFDALSYDGLNAVFDIRDDGLYIMYTTIPEPAALAAILAILTLAIAIYKKRK